MGWWIQSLYWISIAAVAHTYIGYPLFIIWLASRRTARLASPFPTDATDWPKVAILISAYNAEKCIQARIKNLIECEYPLGRMTIVVASDGSTDATALIAKESDFANLIVMDFKERQGKAANLVRAIDRLEGEVDADILVFSDATSHFSTKAITNLARHFVDKTVGVVSGRVCMLTDSGQSSEGLYWRMESRVRQSEANLGIMTGVSGAIYAIRRSMFVEPGCPTINDDMVFPILAKHRHQCRYILDKEAIAEVVVPEGIHHDFRRRRRIGLGVFQSLPLLWTAVRGSDSLTVFALMSHKVLRWLVPFALLLAMTCSLILCRLPLYQVLIGLQLVSIIAALFGLIGTCSSQAGHRWSRLCAIATSFYAMNLALLLGFVDWLSLSRKVVWEPTPRPERSLLLRAESKAVTNSRFRHGPSI